MIYVHFGSKERLFDAVVEHVLGALGDEVPFTEDDLPGFAGRRFDQLVAHPAAVRINRWRMLERPTAGPDDAALYRAFVARMATATEGSNGGPPIGAGDLLIFVVGLSAAWVSTSAEIRTADGTDPRSPARPARHRAALVEAVSRLVS